MAMAGEFLGSLEQPWTPLVSQRSAFILLPSPEPAASVGAEVRAPLIIACCRGIPKAVLLPCLQRCSCLQNSVSEAPASSLGQAPPENPHWLVLPRSLHPSALRIKSLLDQPSGRSGRGVINLCDLVLRHSFSHPLLTPGKHLACGRSWMSQWGAFSSPL